MGKVSIQKAKFKDCETITVGSQMTVCTRINYDWLNHKDGVKNDVYAQWPQGSLPEASAAVLEGLTPGKEFVLVKEEVPSKSDPSKSFWNVKEIRDISIYKEPKPSTSSTSSKGNSGWGKKSGSGYDSLGQQIGNCITNAIYSLPHDATKEAIKTKARVIMEIGNELRAEVEGKGVDFSKHMEENKLKQEAQTQDQLPVVEATASTPMSVPF